MSRWKWKPNKITESSIHYEEVLLRIRHLGGLEVQLSALLEVQKLSLMPCFYSANISTESSRVTIIVNCFNLLNK